MELAERVLAGDRAALARAATILEEGSDASTSLLAALHPHTGRAHIVGLTGAPGSGKSTLIAALAGELRQRSRTVGVLAIDPTSPFTQGALLGDRIRMQQLSQDPGVFIRSIASRGALGGLARAAFGIIAALDAAGRDVILVETVGVGQDEVEVSWNVQTTVVVITPQSGDDIQAMKAGLMEIADIFVVNKADQDGADQVVAALRHGPGRHVSGWEVPVLATIAPLHKGIPELVDALAKHQAFLQSSGEQEAQAMERARNQVLSLARYRLQRQLAQAVRKNGDWEALLQAVASRELDPDTAARNLLKALGLEPHA